MPTAVTPNGQPFVVHPRLTRIAMAVSNDMMIADEVCPRVPVDGEKFTYTKVTTKERLRVPDTRIGRTSEANQVEFGSADETDRTEDHGLESPVPVKDIQTAAAANNTDPLGSATEGIVDLMDLGREIRVADLVGTATNYAAGHKLTLDGTAGKYQFDDYTDSDPIGQLEDALNGMIVRPNTVVLSQAIWTKIKHHPAVVAKVYGPIATDGSATLAQVAEELEVERILVGKAWKDSAAKGQAMSEARVWGNFVALLHLNRGLTSSRMTRPTFCFTAQFGTREAGTYFDPRRGIKGVQVPKVVEQIKELIAWQNAGYLFSDVLS